MVFLIHWSFIWYRYWFQSVTNV